MFSPRKVLVLVVMVATIALLGLANSNYNGFTIAMAVPTPDPFPISSAVGLFEERSVCDNDQCSDDCVNDVDLIYNGGYCYESVCQCVRY